MSYKTYEKYAESNIRWIGKIPEHWEVNRLKEYFFIINGSTPKNLEENWGGSICWITPADYKTSDVYINNSSRQITKKGLYSCGTTLVPKGSIIVSNRAPIGSVAIANRELCTNQGCKSLSVKRNINTKFIYYVLSVNKVELNILGKGTTFMELSSYDLGTFQIPFAPLKEQKQIVNYLDKKTGKINETITKNQQLIDLLEEKRTALINEVVTKGLNPNVVMKNSGVEWIGEIPEDWEVVPFKRLFNNIKDGTHGSFQRVSEGKPLLSAKNVFNNTINISKNESLISEEDYHSIVSNGFPKKQDLLLTIVGTIGRSCVYNKEYPLAFQRSVSFIRLTHDNPYFYNYFVKSELFYSQLMVNAKESAQKGVYLNDIKECLVIKPPIKTQIEIADYLDMHISKINKAIEKIREDICLLEEYKTSLIHHVVTGKIDVRGEEI